MKHFSLKDFSDFLPISKSRGQLSLDSSPTPRCGQWLRRELPSPSHMWTSATPGSLALPTTSTPALLCYGHCLVGRAKAPEVCFSPSLQARRLFASAAHGRELRGPQGVNP